MTQTDQSESGPRLGCPCRYCKDVRERNCPSVEDIYRQCGLEPPRGSVWLERMGAFGRSKATRAVFDR